MPAETRAYLIRRAPRELVSRIEDVEAARSATPEPATAGFARAYGELLASHPALAPGIGPSHFRPFRAREPARKAAF